MGVFGGGVDCEGGSELNLSQYRENRLIAVNLPRLNIRQQIALTNQWSLMYHHFSRAPSVSLGLL